MYLVWCTRRCKYWDTTISLKDRIRFLSNLWDDNTPVLTSPQSDCNKFQILLYTYEFTVTETRRLSDTKILFSQKISFTNLWNSSLGFYSQL